MEEEKVVEKILIVDDEEDFREVLKESLAPLKAECITAGTVDEAIAAVEAGGISCVLLDWRLKEPRGERTGGEVLRFCRKADPWLHVVVMTGVPERDFDVRTDAYLAEADAFLSKPFSGSLACAVVRRFLWKYRATPGKFAPDMPSDIVPLEEVKRMYVERSLRAVKKNVSLAAQKLDVHRHTIATLVQTDPPKRKSTS